MALLAFLVNLLTAVLTFASLIGYAVIYTVWLKRATSQNIVIGGAAGAAPPVLGWTAVTGSVDPNALLLFLIIFVWTPPHFWALAIARRDEYARAGIPMLPVTHGVAYTRLQVLLYTVLLVVVTLLPYPHAHERLFCTWRRRWRSERALPLPRAGAEDHCARGAADAGVPLLGDYLMWLFAALLVDHYLPGLRPDSARAIAGSASGRTTAAARQPASSLPAATALRGRGSLAAQVQLPGVDHLSVHAAAAPRSR